MSEKISPEEFYDNLAANYDDVLKDPKCNIQHLNEAAKIFHQYNYHQGSILDIGCGTGFLSELLQGNFEYTGIDISSKILDYAATRGYKTIHKSIETALSEIDSKSYDFVFCLGSLLCVEDVQIAIEHIYRIARQAIVISLDEATEEFIKNFAVPVYDHSKITITNAIEDYFIIGCGTGFLSQLLQGDFEYTGIDISANMLEYATQRGYKTIHKPIEKALPEIDTQSYDFVFFKFIALC